MKKSEGIEKYRLVVTKYGSHEDVKYIIGSVVNNIEIPMYGSM